MLKLVKDMPYKSLIFIDSFIFDSVKYNLFLTRVLGDNDKQGNYLPEKSHYYIFIYKDHYGKDEQINPCAYIYFFLDFNIKETKYIGTYVNPSYRNQGFASLLTAIWTWVCMGNNFYSYSTNKKQKKPFLLYVLKLHGFEIADPNFYDVSRNTIFICDDFQTRNKCLAFKDFHQESAFVLSSTMRKDNYKIVSLEDIATKQVEVLDQVLISTPYALEDFNKAYTRSRKILDRYDLFK